LIFLSITLVTASCYFVTFATEYCDIFQCHYSYFRAGRVALCIWMFHIFGDIVFNCCDSDTYRCTGDTALDWSVWRNSASMWSLDRFIWIKLFVSNASF